MVNEVLADRGSATPTPRQHGEGNSTSNDSIAQPTTRRKIKVEITSDAICPFCILGLRNLQAAIATAQSSAPSKPLAYLDFELEFKPYLLDPTLTREPIDKREKYESRFGKEKFAVMEKMMKQKGQACGVNFSYDGPVSSTHDYHRVLHAAYAKGGQDLQMPLAERLFSGYFEHQKDPGSRTWLATEAVSSGIFPSLEAANEFFLSDTYDAEVKQGYLKARKMGIHGVPFFVFEGKWAVSGAQPPEAFLNIFDELVKCGCGRTNGTDSPLKANQNAPVGDACGDETVDEDGEGLKVNHGQDRDDTCGETGACGGNNPMVCG
ncbi:hypothetical protein QFC22_002646 [Naganishia vaughanmartiniae]|uniref:Uncharacterized protein n=1 Tax=Naganishia vaughanmartiniae TaxID=1424756 RepID=A0ACC2X9K8_9TREE|nr:hypothetical protein QFC22_002646 [Naganishia vaughanmartiniae]